MQSSFYSALIPVTHTSPAFSLLTALLGLAVGLGLTPISSIAPLEASTGAGGPDPLTITGPWTGASVRSGSVQQITARVTTRDDTARIALRNEDLAFFGDRDPVVVTRTGDKRVAFETRYGTARVDVDSTYRELVGIVGEHQPAIEIHLKKTGHGVGHGSEMRTLSTPDGR